VITSKNGAAHDGFLGLVRPQGAFEDGVDGREDGQLCLKAAQPGEVHGHPRRRYPLLRARRGQSPDFAIWRKVAADCAVRKKLRGQMTPITPTPPPEDAEVGNKLGNLAVLVMMWLLERLMRFLRGPFSQGGGGEGALLMLI
jgi:hypothetical protein